MKQFAVLLLPILTMFFFCNAQSLGDFPLNVEKGEFGAFYTKLNSGMEFEKYSRTGDYADIVVDLGNKDALLVFWRGSSYLPFLKTSKGEWYLDEIIERKGDGDKLRPDKTNTFSRVHIIENGKGEVVVHWRYLPKFISANPPVGMDATKFVDEYFYVKPDGSLKRTIKEGTPRIDSWRDPNNITVQTCKLTVDGIKDVRVTEPKKLEKVEKVAGNPIINKTIANPVAWWKFDEAQGDYATENLSGTSSEIKGNKSLWRKGVSGTALQFDGYNSLITLPAAKAPKLKDAVTFEACLAIGAYPWSYVPIIQQSSDEPEE